MASSILSSLGKYSPFQLLPNFVRPSKLGPKRSFVFGIALGFSISLSLTGLALWAQETYRRRIVKRTAKRVIEVRSDEVVKGVEGLIGNTPLLRIKSLSDLLGVEILGKCEFLNPFGSVKDRVSLKIIDQAEEAGLVLPGSGSTVFEGTSGSTGISIAGIAKARGYEAYIVIPDDIAKEKAQLMQALGATVERVRPVSIVDKKHYVNLARQRASHHGRSKVLASTVQTAASTGAPELVVTTQPPADGKRQDSYADPPRGLFADQFENLSNLAAHYEGTGPEIWKQTSGKVEAFVSGAGTGGTLAGVAKYLREQNDEVEIILADPQGSGLYHKVHDGVMYAATEEEGKRRRHQTDTVVEGIGLNRLTQNFDKALPFISDAVRVTDEEAIAMSRYLAQTDGLFIGSSSAVNLVTCVRTVQRWKREGRIGEDGSPGPLRDPLTIVTILCDHGSRHLSRFWSDEYLTTAGLKVVSTIDAILADAGLPPTPNVTEEPSPLA